MSKRMIDSSVWRSENFVSLPPMARLLMMGMITTADDQGRLQASPMFIRGDFFPGDDDATTKNIQAWLEMLNANKTIILYSVEGKQYAQFVNWWKYQSLQYAMPSKFPKPDAWMDRIRYNFSRGITLTFNWTLTDGTRTANTCDESGLPLQKSEKPVNNSEKPGGNTESNQVDNQVDNHVDVQEEDKDKEEEYKGGIVNTRTHEDENPPLFASLAESAPQAKETAQTAVTEKAQPQTQPEFRESLSGEYMPGLTRPKRYQMQTSVTQTVSDAQKFGVQPQQFREMVDCLLAGCAKRALADTDSPDGEQVLLHAQSTTLTLVKLDTRFRSVTGIQSIFDSWENNDFRGGTVPSSGQVLEHASKMVAGKVTCERKDKPQAKAEPIVVTEKQFIPDMMKPRAPIYAKVKPQ